MPRGREGRSEALFPATRKGAGLRLFPPIGAAVPALPSADWFIRQRSANQDARGAWFSPAAGMAAELSAEAAREIRREFGAFMALSAV